MQTTKSPKRRVKLNRWGNWSGYVGTRKEVNFSNTPFHSQEQEARFWLTTGRRPFPGDVIA